MKITPIAIAVSTLSIVCERLFKKAPPVRLAWCCCCALDLFACSLKVVVHDLKCHNLLLGCGYVNAARQLFVRRQRSSWADGRSLGWGAPCLPTFTPSSRGSTSGLTWERACAVAVGDAGTGTPGRILILAVGAGPTPSWVLPHSGGTVSELIEGICS